VTVVNVAVQPLESGGGVVEKRLRGPQPPLSGEILLLLRGRRSARLLAALLGMHRNVQNVHTRPKARNPKDFWVNIADEATITEGHTIL
jgi:hypothetical protein